MSRSFQINPNFHFLKNILFKLQIWTNLLLGKIRLRESHDERRKTFQVAKRIFEDKLTGKKDRMGPLILERCDIQHELRMLTQSVAVTETHKQIMLELFTLAISRYADVRMKAQSSLFSAFKNFRYSYTFIVPHLIDILGKDTEKYHDAYKVNNSNFVKNTNCHIRIIC